MPSDKDTMEGFLNRDADVVAGDLDGLSERDLKQARALEADNQNRTEVLEAIDAKLGGDSGPAEGTTKKKATKKKATKKTATKSEGGKQARGEERPAWQKPEYDGPLTIDMVEWRNEHLTQKAEGSDKETK